MMYLIGGLIALVVILAVLLRWYILRVAAQQKEITGYKKKMAAVDRKHKLLNKKLKELDRLERERREKNAEIDSTPDSGVADALNDILSDDS